VRFCPSPTGTPHVGLIRTALFNWAHARHHGGAFVFRIEDTDAARDSVESYNALLDALRWLGLDWDEGPEVGGEHGPYRQSERHDLYRDALGRLTLAGEGYESYSSAEEIEARHRAAVRDPKLRCGDGSPLYPLTNPLDDALMGITHVLRGEDLLSSTPRQIALFEAFRRVGIGTGAPTYAHLPLVTGEGARKLSKRDPESNLFHYRDRGFLPEGLLNYLALLGWSIAEDRAVFSLDEMVAAFDVSRVSSNAARFDLKKAEAINSAHMRLLPVDEFAARVVPYLQAEGVIDGTPNAAQAELLAAAAPLVQERSVVLSDAARMLRFLFIDEDGFAIKPRKAFGPVRVAVSGRTVSPPLYESMELLGRERSMRRLGAGLERARGVV